MIKYENFLLLKTLLELSPKSAFLIHLGNISYNVFNMRISLISKVEISYFSPIVETPTLLRRNHSHLTKTPPFNKIVCGAKTPE